MLLPRFSIRWALAATTVFGCLFLVAAQATRGAAWAIAFVGSVIALAFMAQVHAIFFLLARLLSLLIPPDWRPEGMAPSTTALPVSLPPSLTEGASGDTSIRPGGAPT